MKITLSFFNLANMYKNFFAKKISSRDPPRFVYFCFFFIDNEFFLTRQTTNYSRIHSWNLSRDLCKSVDFFNTLKQKYRVKYVSQSDSKMIYFCSSQHTLHYVMVICLRQKINIISCASYYYTTTVVFLG